MAEKLEGKVWRYRRQYRYGRNYSGTLPEFVRPERTRFPLHGGH